MAPLPGLPRTHGCRSRDRSSDHWRKPGDHWHWDGFPRAAISEREKELFDFLVKVNRDSVNIGAGDIEELHGAGWTDEAIYNAITVCALFNFCNRWIDAAGGHEMPDEAHRMGGKRLAEHGYLMTKEE